jgi:predicted nucleic acid-binding protein
VAEVCVDASLVVAWYLPEEFSDRAFELKERWAGEGKELVAPVMLASEVPSALRQAVYRGRIFPGEGDEAFETFLDSPIRIVQPENLLSRAWEIAKAVNAPRLYDAFYIALADIEGCELWTADRRLTNLVRSRFPHVHWLGEMA